MPVRLTLAGNAEAIEHEFVLASPGDISTIDGTAFGRCMPEPGSRDCEPNFFPYVEFTDVALPWQYTPAVADTTNGRLVPWLALAVFEEGEGISLTSSGTCPNFSLSIAEEAGRLLPNPQEAHAWTHIEEREPEAGAEAAVSNDSERFTARMMAPKRLKPNRPYLACVVPLFEAGRIAGLGRPMADVGAKLAWDENTGTLDLPVYHHWRFRSGNRDFEALTRALKAYPAGPDIGLHDLDLAGAGGGLDIEDLLPADSERKVLKVSFIGGLAAPQINPREWPEKHRERFENALAGALSGAAGKDDASPGRYRALDDDPVVGPAVYGSWQADENEVGAAQERWSKANPEFAPGWFDGVNGDPVNRSAAGLGARTLARHQETFVARAWGELSGAREVGKALRNARMAMSASSSLHQRLDDLAPLLTLQVTKGVHDLVSYSDKQQSAVADRTARVSADAVLTAEFRRMANASVTMSVSAASRSTVSGMQMASQASKTALSGKAEQAKKELFRPDAGVRSIELGAWSAPASPSGGSESVELATARVDTIVPAKIAAQKPAAPEDVVALKSATMLHTDPHRTVPQLLRDRVEGLPQETARDGHIERSFGFSLEFDDSTYALLQQLDPDFLLPGFSTVPEDTVMLVETNQQFVESFLIGMNHEMSREFAWRQMPLRLDQSWFRRFWDYRADPDQTDIEPIEDWGTKRRLGGGKAQAVQAVVLVKSELFQRYPDTRVFVVKSKWGKPAAGETTADPTKAASKAKRVRLPRLEDAASWISPEFDGKIGKSANFFGFYLTPEALIGDEQDPGYFLLFEQGKRDPQFGLDIADGFPKRAPAESDNLHWGHFAASQEELDSLEHASANPPWANRKIEGARWGRNSAETARLCRQKQVRMLIPAHTLVLRPGKLAG